MRERFVKMVRNFVGGVGLSMAIVGTKWLFDGNLLNTVGSYVRQGNFHSIELWSNALTGSILLSVALIGARLFLGTVNSKLNYNVQENSINL